MIGKLLIHKIRKNKLKNLIVVLSFFLIITFGLVSIYLYINVENFLIERKFGQQNEKAFSIIAQSSHVPFLTKDVGKVEQFKKDLDELGQDPNIDKLYYFYSINFPITVLIDFFNNKVQTDIFIYAVSDELFLDNGIKIDDETVPIGIPSQLLDFYNFQVANGGFFPKLNLAALKILKISLFFGKSTFLNRSSDNVQEKSGRIKLIDSSLPMIGLTMAESQVKELVKDIDNVNLKLYRAVGYVKDVRYLNVLEKKLGKKYKFIMQDESIAQLKSRLLGLRLFFWGINGVVVLLLINFVIFAIFFIIDGNKKIYKTFRLHGAGKLTILKMILLEKTVFILFGIVLVSIFYVLLGSFISPYLSYLFTDMLFIDYNFINVDFKVFLILLILYVVLILIMAILFSSKEWNKEFEN